MDSTNNPIDKFKIEFFENHKFDNIEKCILIRKKLKSDKLTYEELFYPSSRTSWYCRRCGIDVGVHNNDFSDFKVHLKINHPDDLTLEDRKMYEIFPYNNALNKTNNNNTSQNFFNKKLSSDKVNWEKTKDAMCTCIMDGGYPISMFTNRAIQNYTNMLLRSSIALPSRNTLTRQIDSQLQLDRNEWTKQLLEEINTIDKISFTFDMTTSEGQVPFITITLHYIIDWKMNFQIILRNLMLYGN